MQRTQRWWCAPTAILALFSAVPIATAQSQDDSGLAALGALDGAAVVERFASCRCADGEYTEYVTSSSSSGSSSGTPFDMFTAWILAANKSTDGESKELQRATCETYRTCKHCPPLHYCPPGGLCFKPISCIERPTGFCFGGGLFRPEHSLWGTLSVGFFLCCCCGGCTLSCKLSDRRRLTKSRKQLETRLLEDKLLKRFGEAVIQQVQREIGGGAEAVEIVTHEFKGLRRRPVEQQIGIEFENLGLVLPSGKCVLRGVSGEFQRGMLTAVMGPSGSGKTTFLNVLCGRATYGDMFGSIKINGREGRVDQFRTLFGFVPQDDIVFPDLTVRENLRFSAALRLSPHRWGQESKESSFCSKLLCKEQGARRRDIVVDVLHVLGIDHIADEIVGDVENRGISGGQRKRVNIGLEMVADPAVLFLDEPTSGLDSTASTLVLAALKEVAQLGVTVATVIHQPRYSIFTLFDETLLLAKGGLVVYLGWSSEALEYFESLSFQCPDRVNPADFFLDVISGEVPCPSVQNFDATRDLPKIWAALSRKVNDSKKAARSQFRAKHAHDLISAAQRSSAHLTTELAGPAFSTEEEAARKADNRKSTRTVAAAVEFSNSVGRVFDQFDVSRNGILLFDECKALISPSLHAAGIECSDVNIATTIAAVVGGHVAMSDSEEKPALTRARFVERMSIFRDRALAMRHEAGASHGGDSEEMRLLAEAIGVKNRWRNGLLLTVKHTFTRSVLQLGRHTTEIVMDAILSVVPAFVVGVIFTAKVCDPPRTLLARVRAHTHTRSLRPEPVD